MLAAAEQPRYAFHRETMGAAWPARAQQSRRANGPGNKNSDRTMEAIITRVRSSAFAVALMTFGGAAAAQDQPIELQFFYPVHVVGPLATAINSYVAEFNEAHEGIEVEAVFTGNYFENMARAQAAIRPASRPTWRSCCRPTSTPCWASTGSSRWTSTSRRRKVSTLTTSLPPSCPTPWRTARSGVSPGSARRPSSTTTRRPSRMRKGG